MIGNHFPIQYIYYTLDEVGSQELFFRWVVLTSLNFPHLINTIIRRFGTQIKFKNIYLTYVGLVLSARACPRGTHALEKICSFALAQKACAFCASVKILTRQKIDVKKMTRQKIDVNKMTRQKIDTTNISI